MKYASKHTRSFLFLFKLGVILSIVASIAFLGGCNNGEVNQSSDPNINGEVNNGSSGQGGIRSSSSSDTNTDTGQSASSSYTETTLYFSNINADKLIAEERKVAKTPKIASHTIDELIKGPQSDSLVATIPEGTKLLGLEIKNGIATVNFSSELRDKHSGGSAAEIMTVYSIVSTLTNFPTVKSVQILVDGKVVETLAGHIDLRTSLIRDNEIIQN